MEYIVHGSKNQNDSTLLQSSTLFYGLSFVVILHGRAINLSNLESSKQLLFSGFKHMFSV